MSEQRSAVSALREANCRAEETRKGGKTSREQASLCQLGSHLVIQLFRAQIQEKQVLHFTDDSVKNMLALGGENKLTGNY